MLPLLLIVIALVILAAAFAGVVWIAYNQGVARGRASVTAVVDAPNGPVNRPGRCRRRGDSLYGAQSLYSAGAAGPGSAIFCPGAVFTTQRLSGGQRRGGADDRSSASPAEPRNIGRRCGARGLGEANAR